MGKYWSVLRGIEIMKLRLSLVLLLTSILFGCANENDRNRTPPPPMYFQHSVKYQGETLASIADWYTGDTRNWKAIARANPSIKPERIRIGDIINIPPELVKKTKPYPKPDVRSKPKNTDAAQNNTAETKDDSTTSTPSDQSDNSNAAPTDSSDSAEVAPPSNEDSTTTSTDSAPTEQNDAAMNPPADDSSAPSDEAEREKLREKTRLELLQDVLKSDSAEAPAPEASAK